MFPSDRGVIGDLQLPDPALVSARDNFTRIDAFERASQVGGSCRALAERATLGQIPSFEESRLFVAQRDDRVDLAGAASGQPTREQSSRDQDCDHHGERQGFDRADAFYGAFE